jgi:hypothetical protein
MSIVSYHANYYFHDGSNSFDNFRLVPGLNTIGVTEKDRQALNMASMAGEMLCVIGDKDDDCGYVTRTPHKFFPDGVPVLLDNTDVVQVGNYRHHRDFLYGYRYLKILQETQVARYSHFRLMAHLALAAQGVERETLMKEFWSTIRKATLTPDEDGLPTLGSAWKSVGANEQKGSKAEEKRSVVNIVSKHYARQLEHDPFHGPILELVA